MYPFRNKPSRLKVATTLNEQNVPAIVCVDISHLPQNQPLLQYRPRTFLGLGHQIENDSTTNVTEIPCIDGDLNLLLSDIDTENKGRQRKTCPISKVLIQLIIITPTPGNDTRTKVLLS